MKQHHPDRNQGEAGADERLKAVNAANDALKDAATRATYDETLRATRAFEARAAAQRTAAASASAVRAVRASPGRSSGLSAGEVLVGLGLAAVFVGAVSRGGAGPRRDPRTGRFR